MTYLEALEPYIDKINELTTENEQLKKTVTEKNSEVEELKAQIEKMKSCENCVNHNLYIPQGDIFIKGKDPQKCFTCIFNKLEKEKKFDNWELEK